MIGFIRRPQARAVCAYLAVSGLVFACVTPSAAATLDAVKGTVLVNRGQGFQESKASLALKPGDEVVANPNGHAEIVYEDGCREAVVPGTIAVVRAASGCASTTSVAVPASLTSFGLTPVIIGVAVVGGVVALAVGGGGGGGSTPVNRPPGPASP